MAYNLYLWVHLWWMLFPKSPTFLGFVDTLQGGRLTSCGFSGGLQCSSLCVTNGTTPWPYTGVLLTSVSGFIFWHVQTSCIWSVNELWLYEHQNPNSQLLKLVLNSNTFFICPITLTRYFDFELTVYFPVPESFFPSKNIYQMPINMLGTMLSFRESVMK